MRDRLGGEGNGTESNLLWNSVETCRDLGNYECSSWWSGQVRSLGEREREREGEREREMGVRVWG